MLQLLAALFALLLAIDPVRIILFVLAAIVVVILVMRRRSRAAKMTHSAGR